MNIEEIKKRNERHKKLREFGRSPSAAVSSNKELNTLVFETKNIVDKVTDDIDFLLQHIEKLQQTLSIIANPTTEHIALFDEWKSGQKDKDFQWVDWFSYLADKALEEGK